MMDKPQREVQRELLREEKEVKKKLRANYRVALADVKKWLRGLTEDSDIVPENIRHDKYQRMLEAQLTELLKELGDRNVSVTDDYLREAYKEAHLGCLYRMHHDGVDLILQIDPDRVERAVSRKTNDLQFSDRLYQNVDQLKEETKAEIARGFSTGQDYLWMAARISQRAGIAYGNACRIARTEGHRIANESDMDTMRDAASAGADVVKEWNSTLDDITRSTHRELDGQIRELNEPFEIPSTGSRAMYPGGFGIAKEDIHCRCCMNQRARWALDSERYKYSRKSGAIVSINLNVYKEWKTLYNKYAEILFENADGRTYFDSADDLIRVMQAMSRLPVNAQLALQDVRYEFGGNRCHCDRQNRVIRYAENVSDKEIYHEMGHLLELDMFDPEDVRSMKRRYMQNVSMFDVGSEMYAYSDGITQQKIVLISSDRFIEAYQGRIYVDIPADAFDANGNVRVDEMLEFLSVPISVYFTDPVLLQEKDLEMYEFIRSRIR